MSSTNDNLPPYQEKLPTREATAPGVYPSRLAGPTQTCSIKDRQGDYFSIIRVSDSTYHLSLTVDPTPLYRIELILGPSKVGNIQIFSASDGTLLAAAHASTDMENKTLPVGMICTSSPTKPDTYWRPITWQKSWMPVYFETQIPVVIVPGRPAKPQLFEWRIEKGKSGKLYWDGELLDSIRPPDDEFIFAKVTVEPNGGETLVEIRRGAGIDFELSVILEAFLLLHYNTKPKSS